MFSTSNLVQEMCTDSASVSSKNASVAVGLFNCFVDFIFPIFFILFCYIQMWRHLRMKVKLESSTGLSNIKLNLLRARKNILMILVLFFGCFIATNVYKQVLLLLRFMNVVLFDVNTVHFKVAELVTYMNSIIIPYIYFLHHREFQNGLRKLLCRRATPAVSGNDAPELHVSVVCSMRRHNKVGLVLFFFIVDHEMDSQAETKILCGRSA